MVDIRGLHFQSLKLLRGVVALAGTRHGQCPPMLSVSYERPPFTCTYAISVRRPNACPGDMPSQVPLCMTRQPRPCRQANLLPAPACGRVFCTPASTSGAYTSPYTYERVARRAYVHRTCGRQVTLPLRLFLPWQLVSIPVSTVVNGMMLKITDAVRTRP